MEVAKLPLDEQQRLAELYQYNILDTPHEEEFDELVLLASQICKTPISTITFIDRSRQWAKALVGLKSVSEDRNTSFCAHTILGDELFTVKNTLRDKRFVDNPLVQEKPKIRFYAGMPLVTSSGRKLGALCVIDTIPRKLTEEQSFALKVLSKQTVKLLELRLLNKEMMHTSQAQKKIISVMSHDIRSPLNSISSFLELNKEKEFSPEEKNQFFSSLRMSVDRTVQLLNNLVEWSKLQLEAKKQTEVFNLRNIVWGCIEQAELNVSLKNNEVINLVQPHFNLEADRAGVEFVLRNLVSNANKFTENGMIKISLFTKNNKVWLCVEDNGVGIDLTHINEILDSTGNYTSSGTKNEKGSGLGLSLIKNYLTKSGNEIEIQSKVKEGTRVSFSVCSIKNLV